MVLLCNRNPTLASPKLNNWPFSGLTSHSNLIPKDHIENSRQKQKAGKLEEG